MHAESHCVSNARIRCAHHTKHKVTQRRTSMQPRQEMGTVPEKQIKQRRKIYCCCCCRRRPATTRVTVLSVAMAMLLIVVNLIILVWIVVMVLLPEINIIFKFVASMAVLPWLRKVHERAYPHSWQLVYAHILMHRWVKSLLVGQNACS